jgi:histidine triad (HIT) family protein
MEADLEIIREIFQVAKGIISDLDLAKANYKIITNGGSFQDSQHLHFHLVSGKREIDLGE